MDQDFVERMKVKLLDMKAEILQKLMAEDEEFRDIVDKDDSKDLVDIASSDIDKSTLEALGSQEMKRLRLIEAIPYALYRIEYQNEVERRNR